MSITSNLVPTVGSLSSNCRTSSESNLNSTSVKRSSSHHAHPVPAKRPAPPTSRHSTDPVISSGGGGSGNTTNTKPITELPTCLKKLVRSIVRTFYSREHSLIVDMLVRNTIMKEDDLCERLRFEKKQLGQYLHTLKADQFIKSKLQLETDADGKTTRITHYFIDYKLFVNVVKYKLDQMQRRLETEQRQSTSRATFKCSSCNTNYTDLEVDRLMDFMNPGKLICVYCRADVVEEEDNVSRTDARALIAKFHQQVRDPIDNMLRECDEIHLSPSILEPEIRPLEPLFDEQDNNQTNQFVKKEDFTSKDLSSQNDNRRDSSLFGPTESSVRIVLSGSSDKLSQSVKERPVWMANSTINPDPLGSFGSIDRPSSQTLLGGDSVNTPSTSSVPSSIDHHVTQTLTPGRVPIGFPGSGSSGSSDPNAQGGSTTSGGSADIMQLLLVHERRGHANHHLNKTPVSSDPMFAIGQLPPGYINRKPSPALRAGNFREKTRSNNATKPQNTVPAHDSSKSTKNPKEPIENPTYKLKVGDRTYEYTDITPAIVKTMTPEERAEYVKIGKQIYMNVMID